MLGQIFVRAAGTGATVAVDLPLLCEGGKDTTVADLKRYLARRQGLEEGVEQFLCCGGRGLPDELSLEECGVQQESTVFQSVRLVGGGKKRKKKQFTKSKKTKHKKKNVKLSVLKFYKVDKNDKVSRLRKECPQDSCGSGVFMAMHHDRTYCGRCGLTFIMNKEEEAD